MTTKAERKAAAKAMAAELLRETGEKVDLETAAVPAEPQAEHDAEAAAGNPEAPKPNGKVLKVKAGMKYRGARQSWYERLLAYDGKPLADFVANVTEDRPSVYGARSRHMGNPEPVKGWVRFFERTGVCTEVEHKAE